MRRPASWIIVSKATGDVMAETFLESVANAVNKEKYSVVPIHIYLAALNAESKRETP